MQAQAIKITRIKGLIADREFAIRQVRRDVLKTYYREKIELLTEDEDPDWYLEAVALYKEESGRKVSFCLWTINPREGTDVNMFHKKIKKAIKKKWIVDWMYVIEQRGECEDDVGKGMHCHIFTEVDSGKKIYQCRREMKNTFKNLIANAKHINVQYSKKSENFKNYVMGVKKDESKDKKLVWDSVWRDTVGLEQFYTLFDPYELDDVEEEGELDCYSDDEEEGELDEDDGFEEIK